MNEPTEVRVNQVWQTGSADNALDCIVVEVRDNGSVKLFSQRGTIFGDQIIWLYADDLFYRWTYIKTLPKLPFDYEIYLNPPLVFGNR